MFKFIKQIFISTLMYFGNLSNVNPNRMYFNEKSIM